MGYGICRAQKVSNGIGGIQSHMEREHDSKTNPDIDKTKSVENYSLYRGADHLQKRVNERIRELNLKRKPRKDAIRLLDFIVTASPEDMKKMDAETRKEFFRAGIDFLKSKYGEENFMYDKIHVDESNDHAHVGFVPVTPDGRLCADELMKRGKLQELQDEFYKNVSSKFGLERGEIGTKRKHIETTRLKAETAKKQEIKSKENIEKNIEKRKYFKTNIEELNEIANTVKVKKGLFDKKETVELPKSEYNRLLNNAKANMEKAIAFDELAEKLNKSEQLLKKTQRQLTEKYENQLKEKDEQIKNITAENKELKETAKPFLEVPQQIKSTVKKDIEFEKVNFVKSINQLNTLVGTAFLETKKTSKVRELVNVGKLNGKLTDGYIKKCAINCLKQFIGKATPTPRDDGSWSVPTPDQTDYKANANGFNPQFPQLLERTFDEPQISVAPMLIHIPSELESKFSNWSLLSPESKAKLLAEYEFSKLL